MAVRNRNGSPLAQEGSRCRYERGSPGSNPQQYTWDLWPTK